MFFWSEEVVSIEKSNIVLKNGEKIRFNKHLEELLTVEPIDWSQLQWRWTRLVSDNIIDLLKKYDVRLNDIWMIFQLVEWSIKETEDEAIACLIWKQKLNTLAKVFGAGNVKGLETRNIRIKDIF